MCLVFRVSPWKQLAAQNVLVRMVDLGASVGTVATRTAVDVGLRLLGLWILFVTAFVIFSAIWVTYEEYPETWLGMLRFYNANLGPFLSFWFVLPLQVVDILLRALLPLYDAGVWWTKALLFQGVLPIGIREIQTLLKIATTLFQWAQDTAVALQTFSESFKCAGEACLVPENRAFDLLSGMGQVRQLVALTRELLAVFCGTLSAPLDLLVFPLLDLNFAIGLHSLWNFLLQVTTVVPHVTTVRCSMAFDDTFQVMMCIPDLEPAFNFLVAGISSMGLMVDDWANVAFAIVQNAVTGSSPTCDSNVPQLNPTLFMSSDRFGQNFTAVVGLTQWMYAVTDGYTAIYKGSDDSSVRTQLWPFAMDASLGVAAVSYGPMSDLDASTVTGARTVGSLQTTAMMACNCSNTGGGVEILCAILPLNGLPSNRAAGNYLLQVLFPDEMTARILGTCDQIDIAVHSNRFPATRYATTPVGLGTSTATLPSTDCVTRGTCREVDATVYVTPRCGASSASMACLSMNCFPFCAAVRPAGSANNNLQLVPASRLRSGYTTLAQDCSLSGASVADVGTSLSKTSPSSTVVSPPGLLSRGIAAGVFSSGPTRACQPAQRVMSFQPKPGAVPLRAATRLSGQPLFTTGDTVFTERPLGGGASAVVIERLTSDDHSTFTLSTLSQDFPALASLAVQADENTFDDPGKMLVPTAGHFQPTIAVSSRNYVFYAAPPALQCMQAYMDYCRLKAQGSDSLPQFGFLLTSSYAPIRIYRVKAYQQCSTYSCGTNLVAHVQFEGLNTAYLSADCEGSFNVSVVRLEYLNDDNIAVVVKYSTYAEYDVGTGAINGSNSGYRTYWLNPPTMKVSTTVWQTSVPASNYATLCPAMQRLPRVGTLGAEVLNSGVFLLRWAVNAILYTPGMVPIWRAGGSCPAPGASRRHSVLMSCGQTLFSLDDFFDSLDDANAVVWHSLTVIAQLTSPAGTDPGKLSPVLDILEGMDQYGYAAVDLWSARSSVISLLQFPVYEQLDKTMAALQSSPGSESMAIAGVFKVGTAGIAWARFSYKVVSEISLVIAKEVLQGKAQTSQHIWQVVWGTLYDLQAQYTSVITDRNLMACGGLKLMFGLDNPWANMLYGTCAMNAEYYASVLRMAMDMFVEIPMVKCVCKDSAGLDARAYVQSTCAPQLPVTVRPKLYMIVNQLQGLTTSNFQHLACDRVVSDLQTSLQNELNPVFESFEMAAEALASLVDYSLTPWDKDAGHCLDFKTDPHVVVLVPQPVDYFAKCADTSLCHSLCGSLWEAFQAANATPADLPDVVFTTESLFFPGAYDPSVVLSNGTAVTEINGTGICTDRASSPADYCVAVAQLSGQAMGVQMYCAPQVPGATVYVVSSTVAGYGPYTLPGDVMDAAFLDDLASTLALLLRVGSADAVYFMTRTGLAALPAIAVPAPYRLVRVVSMWPVEGVLVADVVVRSFAGTDMVGSMLNFVYDTTGNRTVWAKSPIDLSPFAGQYWLTRLAGGQHMLIPRVFGLPVYTLEFERRESVWHSTGVVPVQDLTKFNFQGALTNAVLRLDGSFTAVYASTPVTATMQQTGHCDSVSCEGCRDLATNRVCHAYNKCALMNCVGTPVNLKRPMCGVGGVLRSYATLGMQSFRGGWTMFVELLMLVISLSVKKSAGANIAFPEDEFMGYVCSFKDSNAHWWSVLTSALNDALNLGHANVGYMYHGASNVDTNADTVLTITMSSLTNFLHQLSMWPLYAMLVTHQIYICQTNGVMALMDVTGFKLRVQSAALSNASSNVVGQCLTVGDATLARYPNENGASLGYKVGSMLQNAFNLLLIRQIEPMLHMMDGGLAYLSGVLGAMGQLLMSQFAAKCNPPDVYLSDVVQCACGDTPLAIPAARAAETWRDYALWCSGTLVMVDGANNPFIVYNPYSYAQLQAKAVQMQAYVDCASKSYQCAPPSDPAFDIQGVSVLNVLVKCRENFVENRWDPGAYVLFDPTQAYRYRTASRVQLPSDSMGVQACLRVQAVAGASNSACLDLYLAAVQMDYYLYWAYERALTAPVAPQRVDACLTFSGPAAQGIPAFQNCVDDETQDICTLTGHAWSPTSNNTVPIGQPHAVLYYGRQADSLIMRLYTNAYNTLHTALDAAIAHWSVNRLNVKAQFFSAEGDVSAPPLVDSGVVPITDAGHNRDDSAVLLADVVLAGQLVHAKFGVGPRESQADA